MIEQKSEEPSSASEPAPAPAPAPASAPEQEPTSALHARLPPGGYVVRPDGSVHRALAWLPPPEALKEMKEAAIAYFGASGQSESRDSHWKHFLALVIVLGAIYLTAKEKLDGAATCALLGAVVGYVLGQKEGNS